ncbi:MAG: phosphate/phosphite/phosphonate ABC transporter substrate-binding protein [Pseudomonadota bacterium]
MPRAWIGLIVLCLIAPRIAVAGSDPVIFGVFPRWNAQITVRHFTPLAAQLSRELGRHVRIETDKDFDSFMRRVYAAEFDLVHLNQMQYVQAHETAGYRAIAKLCDNTDCTIRAIIVTRRDSKLAKVRDLKGKTIAFGDPGAMVSHVLAKALLLESALGPEQYRTIFTKNPPNALLAVYNGEADAAGVGPPVFQQPEIRQRLDLRELRILAESRPIPHLPIAVRHDMDAKLAQRIQRILTGLRRRPEGREILKKLGIERFEAADDSQYALVRNLIQEEAGAH